MASQNKANLTPVALSAKNLFSKSFPFPALKEQLNTLWIDLSSKLASNSKLTSDKYKKCLKNNLCLYCGIGDYKLDVVATTRHSRTNDLTTSKALQWAIK